MAEGLGLAASVIAVADLTGKTIALTIKLKALWEEVKDVPVTLLEKAEHLLHLEELLDLAEQDAAEDATPTAIWNAINRARAAKNDVQNTIDAYTEELANRRRYRRRIAAAKFVIQKDDLKTVEQKLDRALELYKLANSVVYGRYNRLIYKHLAESTSTVITSIYNQSPIIDPGDSQGCIPSQMIRVQAAKPKKKAIFEGPSALGRLCFDYYDEIYSFSIRVPDWLGGKVYFAMVQRSIAGWQSFLSVYPTIHLFEDEVFDIIQEDDITALQKYLCENNLTPRVHNSYGFNLLHHGGVADQAVGIPVRPVTLMNSSDFSLFIPLESHHPSITHQLCPESTIVMAEALGTAASVIAVIDLAGKAVTLTFKLKCLWDEVKDVPAALLEKAEELQYLDEILRDDEIHAANNPLPTPAWNDAIMQKAMGRARAAMEDLQMTLDAHNSSLEDKRRHRRKFAAARAVLQKDSLAAMERKLDNALRLYRMAENRYIFKTCASINARRLLTPLQVSDPVETRLNHLSTPGDDTFESLRLCKSCLTKHSKPDFTAISKGTTLLGRLLFGLGYQSCHISIRTPNWLGNTVYSVMAQQSVSGWQLNLSSYAVVDEIPDGIVDAVENDDVIDLQRRLREAKLTPYVHDQDAWNLLIYAVDLGAVEISRWLLRAGLYPGSFGEWSQIPNGKISTILKAR
ncbi:hypothetical protein CGLO_06190 [Colletotrichum gloeosporioides Cg-14]|uniref:Uncharacterized protein n=1 Tax=Colletotrichum gloeosporioides (strain Cg-14) TaxID=1237896 RepID=T0LQR9_COLGC|nr:hypothetical protein CGLO_06190 [Colletotrichum gloeosporioides Cg-14]